MKIKVLSVFDSKTEGYLQPFFSQTTGTAIRSFQSAAADEGHDFHRHGADFTLFEFGEFDQSTGTFDLLKSPKNLGNALQHSQIAEARSLPRMIGKAHSADDEMEQAQ